MSGEAAYTLLLMWVTSPWPGWHEVRCFGQAEGPGRCYATLAPRLGVDQLNAKARLIGQWCLPHALTMRWSAFLKGRLLAI
jgi:hypothetical protein